MGNGTPLVAVPIRGAVRVAAAQVAVSFWVCFVVCLSASLRRRGRFERAKRQNSVYLISSYAQNAICLLSPWRSLLLGHFIGKDPPAFRLSASQRLNQGKQTGVRTDQGPDPDPNRAERQQQLLLMKCKQLWIREEVAQTA